MKYTFSNTEFNADNESGLKLATFYLKFSRCGLICAKSRVLAARAPMLRVTRRSSFPNENIFTNTVSLKCLENFHQGNVF